MLKCIIIEDQKPALEILKKYIHDTAGLYLIKAFSDTIEARKYLEENMVDLMFLDINLPQISGIDFLKVFDQHPPTILTTAYSTYALESYEYNVVDYLLKPFSFERFTQAVEKAHTFIQIKNEEKETKNLELYIKTGHDIVKVKSRDVLHIKSDADYTEIFTDNEKYISSTSLKEWLTKLDGDFCQVHKSHIINLTYISKISQNKIYLLNNNVIPLGRSFKKDFLNKKVQL